VTESGPRGEKRTSGEVAETERKKARSSGDEVRCAYPACSASDPTADLVPCTSRACVRGARLHHFCFIAAHGELAESRPGARLCPTCATACDADGHFGGAYIDFIHLSGACGDGKLVALDPGKRLEGRAGRAAAIRAMAVHGIAEGILNGIMDGAAEALPGKHLGHLFSLGISMVGDAE